MTNDDLKTCPKCKKGKLRPSGFRAVEGKRRNPARTASEVTKRICDNCGYSEIIAVINEDVGSKD